MKITHLITLSALLLPLTGHAIKLTDYKPFKFEALFTNPVCKEYKYETPLETEGGELVYAKTKNAYCKRGDSQVSAERANSPHQRLVDWIREKSTKEIFLAYLSFSKSSITNELCDAIKERNIKVTLVMDQNNNIPDENGNVTRMKNAFKLRDCKPSKSKFSRPNNPKLVLSGGRGAGRNKTGYAHNKVFFVNPNSTGAVKIAFSSGNMSTGTVTHHENWNFVTTSGKSFFSQVHKCLMKGVQKYDQGIKEYSNYITKCRSRIRAQEEEDIKVFFVPGEGQKAMAQITKSMEQATTVDVAVHRFSNSDLMKNLSMALNADKQVRLIGDDDLYWTDVYERGMGRNTTNESRWVNKLEKLGMKTHYVETAADDVFEPRSLQLHHNKYLVFSFEDGKGAVFNGAGNFTGSAFRSNFENFYYITIPEVYKAYKKQYEHMWNNVTKSAKNLPTELVLP